MKYINRKSLIISTFLVITIFILIILGVIGYKNNKILHKNSNKETNVPINKSKKEKINGVYTNYIEKISNGMGEYLLNGGNFESLFYKTGPKTYARYMIKNDFKLYVSLLYTYGDNTTISYKNKYVDENVLVAEFYSCEDNVCLKYLKNDGNSYNITDLSEIFKKSGKSLIKMKTDFDNIVAFFPERLGGVNIVGFEAMSDGIDNFDGIIKGSIEEKYSTYLKNLGKNYSVYKSTDQIYEEQEGIDLKIYEGKTSTTFLIKELDFDSLILKINDEKVVDTGVLLFRVLYDADSPILYYLKSDGYWYSYDYYNKDEPITAKIDLDYIIDVRQFTYDTGETIPLFVDIEGNLHEI